MAFHPFATFRKYPKFWMGLVTLMCMGTFVLCSGTKGDFGELLLSLFTPNRGAVLAKIDGRDYKFSDLDKIRKQRKMANDFMKFATRDGVRYLEDNMKGLQEKRPESAEDFKKLQAQMDQYAQLKAYLEMRLNKPNYFGTSTNLDDLVNFKLYLLEADRLGVTVSDDTFDKLLRMDLFDEAMRVSENATLAKVQSPYWFNEVRRNYPGESQQSVLNAIKQEYRAHLAELALLQAQPNRLKGSMVTMYGEGMEVAVARATPTPAQLWDFFKEKRTDFAVTLVPVTPDLFAKEIPEPTEEDLKALFEKHKNDVMDQSSDKPGFKIPDRIWVEMITADTKNPYYKSLSSLKSQLEVFPPVGYVALANPFEIAVRYAAGPGLEKQSYHEQVFRSPVTSNAFALPTGRTDNKYLPELLAYQGRQTPAAWVSALGMSTGQNAFAAAPMAYFQATHLLHKKTIDEALKKEIGERFSNFGTLFGMLTPMIDSPSPAAILLPLNHWQQLWYDNLYVPLDLLQPELKKNREAAFARELVSSNMVALLSALQDKRVSGKAGAIENELNDFSKKFKFDRVRTKEGYTRFDIEKAPELKPLRESYDRYYTSVNIMDDRSGTDRKLTAESFPRIFFEKGDPISLGSYSMNTPLPWPPNVKVRRDAKMPKFDREDQMQDAQELIKARFEMFQRAGNPNLPDSALNVEFFKTASDPIIFWKFKDSPGETPKELAQVRDRVVQAWKLQRARDLMLSKSREIAQSLQKPGVVALHVTLDEANKIGKDRIVLRDIAPLGTAFFDQSTNALRYGPYKLPRDVIPFAREDTVANLLTMPDPKKAVEIGQSDLDNLNSNLYDVYKRTADKGGKVPPQEYVQVLTNKPRNAYYVAVVTDPPIPSERKFVDSYGRSIGHGQDEVVHLGFQHAAGNVREAIVKQIRRDYHVEVPAGPDDRKSFDQDSGT